MEFSQPELDAAEARAAGEPYNAEDYKSYERKRATNEKADGQRNQQKRNNSATTTTQAPSPYGRLGYLGSLQLDSDAAPTAAWLSEIGTVIYYGGRTNQR